MVYRNNEPYNDLPLLPPPTTIETPRAAALHHRQPRAGRIEGCGESYPESVYPDQLDSPPGGPTESEIENIVTTQDALFRAAVEEPGRADLRPGRCCATELRCGMASIPCRAGRSAST